MKHSEKVCRKFYVKHFANREGLCISMKCANILNLNKTEEKFVEKVKNFLLKKSTFTVDKTVKYLEKLKVNIKDQFDNELEDEEVTSELKHKKELQGMTTKSKRFSKMWNISM